MQNVCVQTVSVQTNRGDRYLSASFQDGSPEQLFHVLNRKHEMAVDDLLSQNGIANIGQPVILSILSQQENGTIESQKELARRLRVSPATVTISLKSMERDGYIKKLSNAEDLRCKPISITEKGTQAARLIDQVFETLDHGMYRGFEPEELEKISSLYRRMIENLDAMGVKENKE
jgi:DNA-binding MarR family transcriptional regulator